MKNVKKLFGFLSVLLLIGGGVFTLASCSDDGGDEKTTYSISVAEADKSITLAPGASKTINVTTTGTMVKPSTIEGLTVDIDNSAKTITISASDTITEKTEKPVTVKLSEDESKFVTIAVTVDPETVAEYDTMTLKLTFAEEIGAHKVELVYWQSGDNDKLNGFKTETADVAENAVTFTLSKEYSSDWGFNAFIKVLNSDGTDISDTIELGSFATDDSAVITGAGGTYEKFWFAFTKDTTITNSCTKAEEKAEETMTLNMTFDEALSAAKVKVLYYKADTVYADIAEGTNAKTETKEISENKASITLSNKYSTTWGYNAKFTLYKSDDTEISAWKATSTDSTFGHATNDGKDHYYWEHKKDSTVTVNFAKLAAISTDVDYVLIKVGEDDATVTITADTDVSIKTASDETYAKATLTDKTLTIKAVAVGEASVVLEDANGNEATVKIYVNPKEAWTNDKSYTVTYIGSSSRYQVLGKDLFASSYNIKSVTIAASGIEWSSNEWRYLAAYTQSAWAEGESGNEIVNVGYNAESDTTSGTVTITDETTLTALTTNGLYVAFGDNVKTSKATIKVTYSTEAIVYTKLVGSIAVSDASTIKQIVEPTEFAKYNLTAVKIDVSNISDESTTAWITVATDSSWSNKEEGLQTSKSVIFTNEENAEVLAGLQTNGLWIATYANQTCSIAVSYIAIDSATPGEFTVSSGTTTAATIPLTWSESENATRYVVQYKTGSGDYTSAGVTAEKFYTIEGLDASTDYIVLVTAYCGATGTAATEVNVKTTEAAATDTETKTGTFTLNNWTRVQPSDLGSSAFSNYNITKISVEVTLDTNLTSGNFCVYYGADDNTWLVNLDWASDEDSGKKFTKEITDATQIGNIKTGGLYFAADSTSSATANVTITYIPVSE